MRRKCLAVIIGLCAGFSFAADRYEAETATMGGDALVVDSTGISGTGYVNMKAGSLTFAVNAASVGTYSLKIHYFQPFDAKGKIQNLVVNSTAVGSLNFSYSLTLTDMSSVVKLKAGANTVAITNNWGWVNIDYVEVSPFVAEAFNLTNTMATPNASVNAQKVFHFMQNNFQKKVISGVMTLDLLNGMTALNLHEQKEVKYLYTTTQKYPVVVGFDFMHTTGKDTDGDWFKSYSKATVSMATQLFQEGGIPQFTWHWRDPSEATTSFYTPSGNADDNTTYDFTTACMDASCSAWNTSSAAYLKLLEDIDTIAVYLKMLKTADVPILWRPLHEPSGTWFWWGGKGAAAYVSLYKLLFDRLTNHHALTNLIWVWNSNGADAAWYPGASYVDIIGRDYYYYPRVTNHASLLSEFEAIKQTFGTSKMLAMAECGSVPHPDSMIADGAGWSYFMPWYGDYTIEGSGRDDNSAVFWVATMSHSYVITLDEMPDWANYTIPVASAVPKSLFHISFQNSSLQIRFPHGGMGTVDLLDLQGRRVYAVYRGWLNSGTEKFAINGLKKGVYVVRIVHKNNVHTSRITIQ